MCCTMKFISLPLASLVPPPVHSLLCLLLCVVKIKKKKKGKRRRNKFKIHEIIIYGLPYPPFIVSLWRYNPKDLCFLILVSL